MQKATIVWPESMVTLSRQCCRSVPSSDNRCKHRTTKSLPRGSLLLPLLGSWISFQLNKQITIVLYSSTQTEDILWKRIVHPGSIPASLTVNLPFGRALISMRHLKLTEIATKRLKFNKPHLYLRVQIYRFFCVKMCR